LNKITLREATIDDCDELYRWRNDPVTREQFFDSEVVPYEEHQKWFKKAEDIVSLGSEKGRVKTNLHPQYLNQLIKIIIH